MSRTLWILILSGALMPSARAAEQLNVTANAPAQILLDGQPLGPAPANVPNVPPGFHELQVQSATGEVQSFDLYSPQSASIVKEVNVAFGGPVVQPGAAAPGAVVVQPADESREKKHIRNSLLGAAVANELLNHGSSKGTLRGVTLGGALLNEILNH